MKQCQSGPQAEEGTAGKVIGRRVERGHHWVKWVVQPEDLWEATQEACQQNCAESSGAVVKWFLPASARETAHSYTS